MDPISIGLGVVGLGLQLFGGSQAAGISKQNAQLSAGIAQDEQNVNAQKHQQMVLEGRRMQLEQVRNAQRLRAQATAAATTQGANAGSGLQGGLAQINSQGTNNLLGINQNQEIGNNIFGFNNDISSKRIQQSYLQGDLAQAQGLQSLGGAISKVGPTIGAFGKDANAAFGKMNFGNFFMGGGSPSGYGTGQ